MTLQSSRRRLLLFGAAALFAASTSNAAAQEAPPRLLVLVVFDQFRGDYLARWQGQFGEGGLRRLMQEGAWYTNCHYPYSGTWTAAGHASLLTGCVPSVHGIIGNEWYDRATAAERNCVGS